MNKSRTGIRYWSKVVLSSGVLLISAGGLLLLNPINNDYLMANAGNMVAVGVLVSAFGWLIYSLSDKRSPSAP